MSADASSDYKIMPFAVEAAWVTGRWDKMANFARRYPMDISQDFNVLVGRLFQSLHDKHDHDSFTRMVNSLREQVASAMNASSTVSLQAAHDILLKCHVLTDLEIIAGTQDRNEEEHRATIGLLEGRLQIIGAYFNDKQYVLGIQRATMELTR